MSRHSGHGGGHRGGHGGHGIHIGSMIFGMLIAPWIYRLMHRRHRRPRPVGAHSPLWREISAVRVIHIMTAARILGYLVMGIFVLYLVWATVRIG